MTDPPPSSDLLRPARRDLLFAIIAALTGACVVRARPITPHDRRVWRRMRRRARRRIRRRVLWRVAAGRTVVVVPADLDGDDVIVLEDGRQAIVLDTDVAGGKIAVQIDGQTQELDATFEGQIGDAPNDPEP